MSEFEFRDKAPEFILGCLFCLGDYNTGFRQDARYGIVCMKEQEERNFAAFTNFIRTALLAEWGNGLRFDLGECQDEYHYQEAHNGHTDGYADRRLARERDIDYHNTERQKFLQAEIPVTNRYVVDVIAHLDCTVQFLTVDFIAGLQTMASWFYGDPHRSHSVCVKFIYDHSSGQPRVCRQKITRLTKYHRFVLSCENLLPFPPCIAQCIVNLLKGKCVQEDHVGTVFDTCTTFCENDSGNCMFKEEEEPFEVQIEVLPA